MVDVGASLRAARQAAGISLSVMADRTHYSKSYLGLVETGKRPVTPEVGKAYERVLGVGLGDDVNRRSFLEVTAAVAANARLVGELTASLAGKDPLPLATVQTTHGADLAMASLVDRSTVQTLDRWMRDGETSTLRVNAAGILAKLPAQEMSQDVVTVLSHDVEARNLYLTAVVARVCGVKWSSAEHLAHHPEAFPQPALAADKFARETLNPKDAGARWCSALLLQQLSPMVGR